MKINLHANATTTPKSRAYIQQSTRSDRGLPRELAVTVNTVLRWRKRSDVMGRSHTPDRLHIVLTPAQEAVVVYLRQTVLLSLDDLLMTGASSLIRPSHVPARTAFCVDTR